jgi:hypothetical protein
VPPAIARLNNIREAETLPRIFQKLRFFADFFYMSIIRSIPVTFRNIIVLKNFCLMTWFGIVYVEYREVS